MLSHSCHLHLAPPSVPTFLEDDLPKKQHLLFQLPDELKPHLKPGNCDVVPCDLFQTELLKLSLMSSWPSLPFMEIAVRSPFSTKSCKKSVRLSLSHWSLSSFRESNTLAQLLVFSRITLQVLLPMCTPLPTCLGLDVLSLLKLSFIGVWNCLLQALNECIPGIRILMLLSDGRRPVIFCPSS